MKRISKFSWLGLVGMLMPVLGHAAETAAAVATGLACGLSVVLGKGLVAGMGAGEGLTDMVPAGTMGLGAVFGAGVTADWPGGR